MFACTRGSYLDVPGRLPSESPRVLPRDVNAFLQSLSHVVLVHVAYYETVLHQLVEAVELFLNCKNSGREREEMTLGRESPCEMYTYTKSSSCLRKRA